MSIATSVNVGLRFAQLGRVVSSILTPAPLTVSTTRTPCATSTSMFVKLLVRGVSQRT